MGVTRGIATVRVDRDLEPTVRVLGHPLACPRARRLGNAGGQYLGHPQDAPDSPCLRPATIAVGYVPVAASSFCFSRSAKSASVTTSTLASVAVPTVSPPARNST